MRILLAQINTTVGNIAENIKRIKALIDQIADTGLNTIIYGETASAKS